MKRPVMDPMFLREQNRPPRFPKLWAVLSACGRGVVWFTKLLFRPPFRVSRAAPAVPQSAASKIVRGLVYRAMFVPILISGLSAVVVFFATHPLVNSPPLDPQSQGVYFDPISFTSEDGTQLQGWLVSVVDARRVVLHHAGLGPDELNNLITLCWQCHRAHHDGFLEIVVLGVLTDNLNVRFIRKKDWRPI